MHNWPAGIREAILDRVGPNPEVHPLGGMSGSAVLRISADGRSAVLKRGTSPVETHVYTVMGERMREAGVGLPDLYATFHDGDTFWLLIEDIRHPLPQDRWNADDALLEMLRHLHDIPPDDIGLPSAAYQPAWPEEMSADALSLFGEGVRTSLGPMLDHARTAMLPLFGQRSLISGDPNPLNWGVREDGSLVLYDWERCTRGTPAIDLAITVPGLGDRSVYQRVAEGYLQSGASDDSRRLAAEIGWAKVWSVTEFLAHYARGEFTPTFDVKSLTASYADWVGAVTAGHHFG